MREQKRRELRKYARSRVAYVSQIMPEAATLYDDIDVMTDNELETYVHSQRRLEGFVNRHVENCKRIQVFLSEKSGIIVLSR